MASEKRLIDANAIQYTLEREPGGWGGEPQYIVTQNEIDRIPTVDAVEVVHGQWIAVPSSDMMTGKAYKCSECNKMRYGSFMPNYCSNCGAKMDGGAEHGL